MSNKQVFDDVASTAAEFSFDGAYMTTSSFEQEQAARATELERRQAAIDALVKGRAEVAETDRAIQARKEQERVQPPAVMTDSVRRQLTAHRQHVGMTESVLGPNPLESSMNNEWTQTRALNMAPPRAAFSFGSKKKDEKDKKTAKSTQVFSLPPPAPTTTIVQAEEPKVSPRDQLDNEVLMAYYYNSIKDEDDNTHFRDVSDSLKDEMAEDLLNNSRLMKRATQQAKRYEKRMADRKAKESATTSATTVTRQYERTQVKTLPRPATREEEAAQIEAARQASLEDVPTVEEPDVLRTRDMQVATLPPPPGAMVTQPPGADAWTMAALQRAGHPGSNHPNVFVNNGFINNGTIAFANADAAAAFGAAVGKSAARATKPVRLTKKQQEERELHQRSYY